MKAGLLADIILGESPHLKGLARHFNLILVDANSRITGFNNNLLKNIMKKESQVIHQNFAMFFDSEEGKANLSTTIKKALNGQPCSIQFSLLEARITFKGVVLPIYDENQFPDGLIIISKEEKKIAIDKEELDDFWAMATKMIEEAGISSSGEVIKESEKLKKPKILLVEDKDHLVASVFKSILSNYNEEAIIAPGGEAALLMAKKFKPNVIICTYNPIGQMSTLEIADQFKKKYSANTIYISQDGGELRIEDGWLDIHVKNHSETVSKILDLINQLYW
jgi:hypothetical protein